MAFPSFLGLASELHCLIYKCYAYTPPTATDPDSTNMSVLCKKTHDECEYEALTLHQGDLQSLLASYKNLKITASIPESFPAMCEFEIDLQLTSNNISVTQTEQVKSLIRHLLRETTAHLHSLTINIPTPSSPYQPSTKQLRTHPISKIAQEISGYLADNDEKMMKRSPKKVVLSAEGTRNDLGMFARQPRYVLTNDEEKKAGMSVRPWEEDGEQDIGHVQRSGVVWRRL